MTIVCGLTMIAALLTATAAPATAGKLLVANDGVDGPDCGSRAVPCRSINHAITRAAEGTTIVVGPGRYGPGDEQPPLDGCSDCLIDVAKRVTIVSRDGAGATVLDAAGERIEGVLMRADGATFGRKGKGFIVIGGGIGIAMRAAGLRVEGNWVVRNDSVAQASGILAADAARSTILANMVSDNDSVGISLWSGGGHVVANNRVSGHRGVGIYANESSARLTGNAVSSESVGIQLRGDHDLVGNAVVATDDVGIVLDHGETDPAHYEVSRNTITGSRGQGMHVQEGEPSLTVAVTKNGLFGNGLQNPANCGLLVERDVALTAVTLAKNFWGAAAGPAAVEPADDACENVVATGPFAKRERRLRLRSAQ